MHFYAVVNGRPEGPLTIEELKLLKIEASTFIKLEGMDDFKQAHEIPAVRQLFNFNSQAVIPQYFASLDVRLLAVSIDYFLVTAVYAFIAVVAGLISGTGSFTLFLSLSALVFMPVLKFVYAVVMEASAKQGTLGKLWLGLRVCTITGNRPTLKTSLLRNLSKVLSSLTLGIGYLTGFLNRKQQCLHDKVAGTVVVKDRLV